MLFSHPFDLHQLEALALATAIGLLIHQLMKHREQGSAPAVRQPHARLTVLHP